MTFRCSAASALEGEPLAGTAPTDRAFLFVEYAGAWGRNAPDLLREHVQIPDGLRPQLIRRYRSTTDGGLRVFIAWRPDGGSTTDEFRVETTTLADLTQLDRLDLVAPTEGRSPGLDEHTEPLWLVCTNGRRDVCCAELGRPVTAALSEQWPGETWETSHLGGHRFAATLLALPSGITLGRVDPVTVKEATQQVADGDHPTTYSRGRAGLTPAEQAIDIHATRTGIDPSRLRAVEQPTPPRRLSCADELGKPSTQVEVVEL